MTDSNQASTKHKYLKRKEAAEVLNAHGYPTAYSTLCRLASVGEGPEYRRWGKHALYREDTLLSWAEARAHVIPGVDNAQAAGA